VRRTYFWASAVCASVAFAAIVALLFPYSALGYDSIAEMRRAWLLTVFTGGAMAICFGFSGLLSTIAPVTFADVAQAGSVPAALSAQEERKNQEDDPFYNFAGWTVSTGVLLILIYFAGWFSLGR